jgi:23S rRNA pseudouridine2605 synthase
MKQKRQDRHHVERDDDHGPGERLQKVLAAAGVGSRRDCEELIREGRVEVDRQVVTELGTRVDPLRQEIRLDGEVLRRPQRLYFAVNKPVGVVTTNFDPAHRQRVIDLVPTDERVFAVGRLDRSSEGLILVTNDGEFANRITHPRYGVEKTYLVRVAGAPDQRQLARLKKGVHLAEGYARAQSIVVKRKHGQSTDLVIVLNEGRNREIRRILARVGHKALALKRVAVGPIKLGDLPVGAWRRLMPAEVEALLSAAKEKRREARKRTKEVTGDRGQGTGDRGPGTGKDKVEAAEPYLQKQALLSQPLSLDDLLRDDLDEGPLGPADSADRTADGRVQVDSATAGQGGVIDYEDELAPPHLPPEHKPRYDKPPRRKPPHGNVLRGRAQRTKQGARPAAVEKLPRENFGRKRGGKRVFGPPHEGRGPAGEMAGSFRFRPKKKKGQAKRRGAPLPSNPIAAKKFGKSGRKRKGRR